MGKVTQFKVKPGYLGGSAQVIKAYSEFKAPTVGAELRNSWQEGLPCEVRITRCYVHYAPRLIQRFTRSIFKCTLKRVS